MTRSFGPSGYRDKDGVLRLSCVSSATYCFLLHGRMCSDQKPPREVENPRETPEWCKYAAGMRKDILEMEDFDRMGLADMTRAELMPLMKAVPVEFRAAWEGKPYKLTEHNAAMMRHAIRKHRMATDAEPGQ